MSDLKKLMTIFSKIANAIHRGNNSSANCIIIEPTNPFYDEMVKILEEKNRTNE